MKLVKSFFIIILIPSILLQGCFTFVEVGKEDLSAKDALAEKQLKIHLKDGKIILSGSHQHNFVIQPVDSAGIICDGYYLNSGQEFHGFINNNEIKFVEVYKYSGSDSVPIYVFAGVILFFGLIYLTLSSRSYD